MLYKFDNFKTLWFLFLPILHLHDTETKIDINLSKVRDWLEKVYCDEVIPQYEINERTIEILLDLKQKNEEREREAEILIKDYEHKTEEYHAESK